MKSFKLILCCLLLATARAARAEDDAPAYQLLSHVEVDSTGIFLDQIVVPPAAHAALPHLHLAQAPNLGQVASLSRTQITELAQSYPGLITTNWSGATQIRVSRRTRQFTDSDLIERLTALLQQDFVKDRGQLELHLGRPWVAIAVPDETLTLKVADLPQSGLAPNFVLTAELWNGRERVNSWQIVLQAAIWRDVPVARTPLLRGQSLRNADVTMLRRDVLQQKDIYLNFPPPDDTLEIASNVQADSPILNRDVRPRPLIVRGRVVEGLYQEGALSISLKVETLEDGLLGQTVRVRNPKTKRELYGKVQNEQTVLITL